jgi:hypothetical protein
LIELFAKKNVKLLQDYLALLVGEWSKRVDFHFVARYRLDASDGKRLNLKNGLKPQVPPPSQHSIPVALE